MLMWYLHQGIPLIDTDSLGDIFFSEWFYFLLSNSKILEQGSQQLIT